MPAKSNDFIRSIVKECYMPIKCLNAFASDWKIKARVTKKGDMRTWNNAKGTGKLMNIDLVDREGTGIQATFFNEQAEKFCPMLIENKVYLFSNGQVKMANKRFTSIKNDFSITFDRRTQIEEVGEDDESIQAQSFSFIKICEVENLVSYATVDVCGVLIDVKNMASIQLKDGTQREKRTVTIGDDTQTGVDVTVWGELASE